MDFHERERTLIPGYKPCAVLQLHDRGLNFPPCSAPSEGDFQTTNSTIVWPSGYTMSSGEAHYFDVRCHTHWTRCDQIPWLIRYELEGQLQEASRFEKSVSISKSQSEEQRANLKSRGRSSLMASSDMSAGRPSKQLSQLTLSAKDANLPEALAYRSRT